MFRRRTRFALLIGFLPAPLAAEAGLKPGDVSVVSYSSGRYQIDGTTNAAQIFIPTERSRGRGGVARIADGSRQGAC